MKAVIRLDVPEWQIGQEVHVIFRDTMEKNGVCEAEQSQIVRCKDCVECFFASNRIQSEQTFACGKHGIDVTPEWFCADGEQK